MLYDGVSSKDKTLKIYEGMCQDLFHVPEHEQVLSDVAAWLDERL